MTDAVDSPAPLAPDLNRSVRRWAPSLDDPLVAPSSERIGGPVGTHAAIGRARFSALRVLFALALVGLAIGFSGKTACLQQAPSSAADGPRVSVDKTHRLNWDNQREMYSLCYTDVVAVYGRQHLGDGVPFWTSWQGKTAAGKTVTQRWATPVGTGMFAYGAAKVVAGWQWLHVHWGVPSVISPVLFFNLVAVVLALCWLVTIWVLVKLSDERRWFVWVAALSPVIFVHAFTSFDLLTVMLVMLGLLAWDRRRWWASGVLFGLALTTGLWPLLVLLALGLSLYLERRGRARPARDLYRDPLKVVVAVLATWLVVNLPVAIGASTGWLQYWRFFSARAPEPDSLYGAIATLVKLSLNVTAVNVISLVLVIAAIAAVIVIVVRSPKPFDVYSIAFLLIAGTLIASKTWSPQSTLWLVPFAVLAVRSSRILMVWMLIEALAWVPRMGVYLAPSHHWLPPQWYTLAVVVRMVALLGVCLHIIWEHYDDEPDVVETPTPHLSRSPLSA
ncbi:MAG: glycosyltransferase 87 family protein [Gordonia sp. (in: high G+C Gram-positive bacteria)]|uniref:glycosyltransferase 87 family protein n=1 Tax=Gordonia sp. (in: high G+C Gram-positive bacteria) TaxID=84139 RepID=UPI0039E655E7